MLFNGHVHPHLEHCVQVWSPYLKRKYLEKLQTGQKKLTKRLADTLAIVHATMLEKQRTGGELIQVFVTY